jgi:hypothetical protein
MDPIEILGSLLGRKADGSGAGADILRDILLGGTRGDAPSPAEPAPTTPSRSAPSRSRAAPTSQDAGEDDIARQARELEDLLNVAKKRTTQRTPSPQAKEPAPSLAPGKPGSTPVRQGGGSLKGSLERPKEISADDDARQSEQATILVRAMVNAAKCDGQISREEQQSILGQLADRSPEAVAFLREEFDRPFDVREFAWSVPVGMEQQVYTMSLIAVDLDTEREQRYLRDLAHGLRLAPEICEQIKDRLTGAGTRYVAAR